MISQRLGVAGPITEQTEEYDVVFPIEPGGTFGVVTVQTRFTMGAGSMVIVSFDQAPPLFLVPNSADIDANGLVTINYYDVVGLLAITHVNTHLNVKAHNAEQFGR